MACYMLVSGRKCKKCLLFMLFIAVIALCLSVYLFGWATYDDLNAKFIIDATFDDLPEFSNHYANNLEKLHKIQNENSEEYYLSKNITKPIIIWWTPFTMDLGSYRVCGEKKHRCFLTNIRKYRNHKQTKAFLFYGTDFYLNDLPLPRRDHEEWGLLHEESPKNNYLLSFPGIIGMFNHTATFKQESDLPLVTQYLTNLEDLTSKTYLKSVELKNKAQKEEGLAPIAYIQSDCYTPSNRDIYVRNLMKHIKVDSYGRCLHNKDLPENLTVPVQTMSSPDLYEILSKYKFILSMENAVCDDYVTEKLWRTYYVGSVPIVFGGQRYADIVPTVTHGAIDIRDYKTAKDLADYIKYLDSNDAEYEKYLSYKHTGINNERLKKLMNARTWGINNDMVKGNYIDKIQCLMCERIHENMARVEENKEPIEYKANMDHFGCPKPITFNDSDGSIVTTESDWLFQYEFAYCIQKLFFDKYYSNNNFNFTMKSLQKEALGYYHTEFSRDKLDL